MGRLIVCVIYTLFLTGCASLLHMPSPAQHSYKIDPQTGIAKQLTQLQEEVKSVKMLESNHSSTQTTRHGNVNNTNNESWRSIAVATGTVSLFFLMAMIIIAIAIIYITRTRGSLISARNAADIEAIRKKLDM